MPDYPETGEAQVAETKLDSWRLVVRRTRLLGAQAELWARLALPLLCDQSHRPDPRRRYRSPRPRHHRTGDPRSQGPGTLPLPLGRFHANSAWTVIAALAHNLARWTTLIGLPTAPVQTAHSRRRHLLAIPGRLTRLTTSTPAAIEVVGEGSDRPACAVLVTELGLGNVVRFHVASHASASRSFTETRTS